MIKYTKNPKPIEGVDYFNEIPVYRHKKKMAVAREKIESYTQEITVLEAKLAADTDEKPSAAKLDALREKLKKAEAEYAEAKKKSDEQDAKKAEKLAKKVKS